MGDRQETIDKDLGKSANDFEIYVKPHVLRLLKGKIKTVEGVTDDWMTRMLDVIGGVDAWYIDNEKGIRGIASRCFNANKDWRKEWASFTIRLSRGTKNKTEYLKLVESLEEGWLYPYWTIQAYINHESKRLVAFAIAKTEDVLDMIEKGKCEERKTKHLKTGESSFYVIKWQEMRDAGYKIYFEFH